MPYKSKAQAGFFHTHKAQLEAQGVDVSEWDRASKGKSLPYRITKKAEGGAIEEPSPNDNVWNQLPKGPSGRPMITVDKRPEQNFQQTIGDYAQRGLDWMRNPYPETEKKPAPQMQPYVPEKAEHVEHWKDVLDPYYKDEQGKYYKDQPPVIYPGGKIQPTQKDAFAQMAPAMAEAAMTAPIPGPEMVAPAAKAAVFGFGALKKAAKPAAKMFEHGFLDTSKFVSTSGSKGTMMGGFMKDPKTGTEWYVKAAPSLEQAKNEKLTAELYKLLGVPTADVELTQVMGQPGIASKKIENAVQLSHAETPYHEIEGLHENFPIHAWLGNHDAVGTGPENPLGNIMVDASQKAHVIDTGGGLRFKGTGTPKSQFNPTVDEIETMANPNYSPISADVFGGADPEAMKIGAQKIANVDEKSIALLVEKYGPADPWAKVELLSKLLLRKKDIETKFGVKPGDPLPQMKAKDPFKQEPLRVEDDFNKPLTDDDWEKILGPAPPPDDFAHATETAKESFGPKPTPAEYGLGPSKYEIIAKGKKLDKATLGNISGSLVSGPAETRAWDAAHWLWDIAENVNPQTAEALFRALPAKIQIDVGQRIQALKNELDYSPFNSVAKGSGKEGKIPSEYDYYKTNTNSPFWNAKHEDADFQSNLKKYASHIENKKLSPAEKEFKEPEWESKILDKQSLGWSSPALNGPKDAYKLLQLYKTGPGAFKDDYDIVGIGKELAAINKVYPGYGNVLAMDMPSHLKGAINAEKNEASKIFSKAEKAKEAEKAALGKFTEEEGRAAALYQKDSPVGLAFAQKYLEPIKDWKNWKPPTAGYTKPFFGSELQRQKVKNLGFNTEFEIHKGGSFTPDPYNPNYPTIIPDPSVIKNLEKAWFGADQSFIASQYGSTLSSYVARGKAFEVDWKKFSGAPQWEPAPMHNLIEAARKQGADIIAVHGMSDIGGANQTQYAVLNPAVLRAPNAKFDPKLLDKSWPLAGLVGGGLFTYGTLKDDKMNRGGKPMASGGSNLWATKKPHYPRHPAGMIKSAIPGRTDKIPMSVPAGSFIIPADIPSAVGQGNTMAGEKILGQMFKIGPYGSGMTGKISGGRPARIQANWMRTPRLMGKIHAANGGEMDGPGDIPVIAAGGEMVLHPEHVREIGNGDLDAGHKVLNKFVLGIRKNYIETLKKLKPPKNG